VPRGTAVGDDDAPDRVLARPDPRESDPYGHVRRLRLAAGTSSPHAPQELLRVGHLASRQLRHHLPHLAELLDELVHGLHGGPGAMRDPLTARAVDHLRPG